MTGTKEGAQLNSKPIVSKGPANRALVWASVFKTKSSDPTALLSTASALCQPGRRTTNKSKGAFKRVHFAPQPVVSYLSFHSDTALSTWYGDEDYELFLADCCHTVRKAQDLQLTNGEWSDMDPAQESLLGLEHFLSPTLERERKERCKRHVHKMLAAQSGNDSGNHGKIATGVAPNKTKTFVP
jgi:hypothetical protein